MELFPGFDPKASPAEVPIAAASVAEPPAAVASPEQVPGPSGVFVAPEQVVPVSELRSIVPFELSTMPTPERAERLREALATAKVHIAELRRRIVIAESVAYIWMTVPEPGPRGEGKRACGEIIRRICCTDGDLSLRTALAELDRDIDAHLARRPRRLV